MAQGSNGNLDRMKIQALPKVLLHEHLDCSVRTSTMLEFWRDENWHVPENFPERAKDLFEQGNEQEAAALYQDFLAARASLSLANYVTAIVQHVLPLMQSASRLSRIALERVEDAIADGVCALELRFAPQLHTRAGLSLAQVMDAILSGVEGSRLPLRLTVCALRHENAAMARKLADLCIANSDYVGAYDLAGDEKASPGVLLWWANEAIRVREYGVQIETHLWETDEPTDEDLVRLAEFEIERLGHGMRGNRQENRILEVCPSSNVVTGQISRFADHPIDKLLKEGKRVTVNTDGTLFTRSDLSNEYLLLNKHFGWGNSEFHTVNKTAIEASSFPQSIKDEVSASLDKSYSS